jgi:hypothetical protein
VADVVSFAKDLALEGGPPLTWRTPWMPWPAQVEQAQFVVICKSRVAGDVTVRLYTTWDTDSETLSGGISVNAVGTSVQNLSTIGPLVAVRFVFPTANTKLVVSAYVTPKEN